MCNKSILQVALCDKKLLLLLEMCNASTENERQLDVKNLENILPTEHSLALIVANSSIRPISMQWGFNAGGSLVINARCETAEERPMFRPYANRQRCVLPATGYYEWRDTDGQRHLITRRNSQPFYIAGLYQSDEKGRLNFVVLTRSAYGPHAKIHSRMPCLLFSKEEAMNWLTNRMPLRDLYSTDADILEIEAQGLDQLRMEFDD